MVQPKTEMIQPYLEIQELFAFPECTFPLSPPWFSACGHYDENFSNEIFLRQGRAF